MEAILLPLVVMFFILVMTLGVDRASKAILPLTIIGILVYFFGWDIFKYAFLFILFIVFLIFFLIFKVLKKAGTSSNTYRRTRTQNDDFFGGYRNNTSNNNSNGTRGNNTYNDTRYYGNFRTREEAEEFFRNIFGRDFGQNGTYKLDARFNKERLSKLIIRIAKYANHIHIYNEDALSLLQKVNTLLPEKSLIYLDPPYYVKGQGLYRNFYNLIDQFFYFI